MDSNVTGLWVAWDRLKDKVKVGQFMMGFECQNKQFSFYFFKEDKPPRILKEVSDTTQAMLLIAPEEEKLFSLVSKWRLIILVKNVLVWPRMILKFMNN